MPSLPYGTRPLVTDPAGPRGYLLPMDTVDTLREQARILRRLAASAHGSGIRDRLERLAEQCEDLADSIEQNASNDEA
jgi:hypothetical protein